MDRRPRRVYRLSLSQQRQLDLALRRAGWARDAYRFDVAALIAFLKERRA